MRPTRRFLFLQGPHGPFYHRLGVQLRAAGAEVLRVGFNGGDAGFWPDRRRYLPYRGRAEDWPDACAAILDAEEITDVVIYGDTRPVHAAAAELARARGLRLHVFEEGYLRPWWVTYERGGANANSRLVEMDLPGMRAALAGRDPQDRPAPGHWGDMRHHVFYGAIYHFLVLALAWRYRAYRPHRGLSVLREFRLHLRRLATMPVTALRRAWATRAIERGAHPYHLCLLQLEHDASMRAHSSFATTAAFLAVVVEAFARGAPRHHHLVVKSHPLDDGGAPTRCDLRRLVARHGLDGRVHYVHGGKLARLMDAALGAVTINSTAAQQALWRGLPVRALGRAVYRDPAFVSTQPLADFFADPTPPDRAAYATFRHYLLETSQVRGGFYSGRGRRALLRRVTDMMLSDLDPYDRLAAKTPDAAPALRLVSA